MTYGSLFSGIGGLDLGVELATGARCVWQAESDPYARAELAKRWPDVRRYEDVRQIDENAERPDVICGGFPCQDISAAGRRAGIDGDREVGTGQRTEGYAMSDRDLLLKCAATVREAYATVEGDVLTRERNQERANNVAQGLLDVLMDLRERDVHVATDKLREWAEQAAIDDREYGREHNWRLKR